MDALLKAVKDVWDLMLAIGYDPVPTLVAIAVWIIGRERFVRPIRRRPLDKGAATERHNTYKRRILYASFVLALLTTVARNRPADLYDSILVLVWSVVHTGMASVLYTYLSTKKFMVQAGNYVRRLEDREDPEEGYV